MSYPIPDLPPILDPCTDCRKCHDRVVAYVTNLGYVYCAACAAILDIKGIPVHHNISPHCDDPCDRCGLTAQACKRPKTESA